ICSCFVFLLSRPPPRPTLFPYTTLFRSFHEALMENQPVQGQGPSDRDVADVARGAGVPEDVIARLADTADSSERAFARWVFAARSEEHTSELQSRENLVCRLLLEKKK